MRALPARSDVQREAIKLGASLRERSLRDAFREIGAFGLFAPDLDAHTLAHTWEGLGESADAGLCFALGAHACAALAPIAAHGSDRIKAKHLAQLRSGEQIGAHAASEAEAGSDTMAMAARAEPDGDGYLLSGSKLWVTNGAEADVFVVFARVPEQGVTGFVLERGAAGLTVGAPMDKMGLARASLTSLYLEGCRVPADAVLEGPGRGAAVFHTAMLHERALILAPAVGVMRAQLEAGLKHARTRRQFGRPIGKNQLVAARVVEMYERYVLARMLLEKTCAALVDGTLDAPLACLTKLRLSEWALAQHLDAIRLHGGTGYLEETGLPAHLRDAIGGVLYSGTSDMQRVILAAHLGL